MSRFFKSAAFPILIVVVLAFFAQRLISPSSETKKPDFGQFLTQINQGQVKSADIKTKDNTVDVTLNDGRKYTVGYPDGYAKTLVDTLHEKASKLDVQGKGHALAIAVRERHPLDVAPGRPHVDHTPIGEVGDRQLGDAPQRLLVVERGAEQLAGCRVERGH